MPSPKPKALILLLLHAVPASSSSAWAPPAAPGAACGLLVFDGTSASDVTLPEPTEPINAAGAGITLSVWLLQTVALAKTPLVYFANGPGFEGFAFGLDDNPWWDLDVSCCIPMTYYVFGDTGYVGGLFPPSAETGPGSFPQKQWVHVALVHAPDGMATIYWDGVQKGRQRSPLPNPVARPGVSTETGPSGLYVGHALFPEAERFQGMMQDLFFFNAALSPSQLTALRDHREFPTINGTYTTPLISAGCAPSPPPMPPSPPLPPHLPPCVDIPDGAFTTTPTADMPTDCPSGVPAWAEQRNVDAATLCDSTMHWFVLTTVEYDFVQVALPQGVAADARIAAMCPITCALHGVYADGCAPPSTPPTPPTPPLPPGIPPMPPVAPILSCELSACQSRGGYDNECCDIFRHVACAPGYDLSFVLPVSAGVSWDPVWEQAATGTEQLNEFCWLYNGLGNTCCSPAAPRPPLSPPVAPSPPLPPPFTSRPPLVPGAIAVSSLSELRSYLNVANKEPLHLQLPEGAHFALGGFPLEVFHRNLTLRSTGSGATLDGEFLSQLLTHGCPYCFDGVCNYVAESCVIGWCDCRTTLQLHNIHLINGRDWTGGAVQSIQGTRVELTDCTIESCGAVDGGAFYVGERASLTLTNSTITHCHADRGGAISVSGGSTASLINSRITSCSSRMHGGAVHLQDISSNLPFSIYQEGAHVTLTHSQIIDCHANGTGGALSADTQTTGGGQRAHSTITVTDSSIIGCSAMMGGGALMVSRSSLAGLVDSHISNCSSLGEGGAVFARSTSAVTMLRMRITLCSARIGGAMSLSSDATATLHFSTIMQCNAHISGGGLSLLDSAATLLHTTITGCRAEDANATAQGGGIAAFRSTVLLANGSLIIGSYASGSGRALAITGSQVVFKLPAPPGRWIAGTLCAVYRAACPTIEDSAGGASTQDPDCLRTASQCSQEQNVTAIIDGVACQPTTFAQV